MSTEVKGSLVNLIVRKKGTVTWLTLVCTEDSTFTLTRDVTEIETNCGLKTGRGILKFNASGNAVSNATPTAAEASYQKVKEYMVNDDPVEFQWISAADAAEGLSEGEGVNNFGTGNFTNVEATGSAPADGVLRFSWTLTGRGTLDEYES